MAKQYALMIWKHDRPVTGNVLKLDNIVFPRKALEEYRVGDVVTARLRGYGTPEGVIGKIGGDAEKEDMQNILTGDGFAELLMDLGISVPENEETTCTVQIPVPVQDDIQNSRTPNGAVASVTSKTKRKSNNTTIPKPKKKKQTLEIEKAGENLEIMEMEMEIKDQQEKQANVVSSIETSSILLDTFNILNSDRQSEATCSNSSCSCEGKIEKLKNELSQLQRKIVHVESENQQLWYAVNEIKENVTWLYYNKQPIQIGQTAVNPHTECRLTASASSAFTARSSTANTLASVSDSSSSSQNNVEYDSSVPSKQCSAAEGISSGASYQSEQSESYAAVSTCNYTKEQLSSMISHISDYCKAAKFLFRRLYKEEEYAGRSLTGHQANSTTPKKPAIEDKSKMLLIYDVIRAKWPYVSNAMVNSKIAEVLKPCRQKKN